MKEQKLPPSIDDFQGKYPDIWKAFADLAQKCHEAGGPLDERTRRLVKLAIAVGMRQEGAVHSAARHALYSGIPAEALYHVAVLAITTLGFPAAYAALTWIRDVVQQHPTGAAHNLAD